MKLLIDIGNTRLKWICESNGKLSQQNAIEHRISDWQAQILSLWQSLNAAPETIAISCVAKSEILQSVMSLANQLWPGTEIVIPKSQPEGFGVINSYQQPEKLGVDRWLCLIAARRFYKQAVWIVDCGTAITVDFLDEQGRHGGGLIAPGLTLMKKSLLKNTAALNFTQQVYQVTLTNQTEAAIFSGTLLAAVGLIEHALKMQSISSVLLLTGGDAALIGEHLSQTFIMEPDLVFKGLSLMSRTDL